MTMAAASTPFDHKNISINVGVCRCAVGVHGGASARNAMVEEAVYRTLSR
jgi:hypothetical protein